MRDPNAPGITKGLRKDPEHRESKWNALGVLSVPPALALSEKRESSWNALGVLGVPPPLTLLKDPQTTNGHKLERANVDLPYIETI